MSRQISEIDLMIEKALELLRARVPVTEAYLFGSRAEGQASEFSDIDLAVFTPAVENMKIDEKINLVSSVQLQTGSRLEIHLYNDKALQQARPTNIYGHIISTGKKIA